MSLSPGRGVGERLFKIKAQTMRQIIGEFYYIKMKDSCSMVRTLWTKLSERVYNGKQIFVVFQTNGGFILEPTRNYYKVIRDSNSNRKMAKIYKLIIYKRGKPKRV